MFTFYYFTFSDYFHFLLHLVVHRGQENIDRAATLSMFSWPEKSPQLLHVPQPAVHSYGCSGHNTKECSLHVLLPTVTLKNYYIRYDFDRVVIFKTETNIFVTSFVWHGDVMTPNLTFMYNDILIWHGDGCPPSHWRITTNSSKINNISQLVPVCRLMFAWSILMTLEANKLKTFKDFPFYT